MPFTIPPLRERKGDIPLLVEHFLEKYATLNNQAELQISDTALKQLVSYDWKGNIRELENTIERAVLLNNGSQLLPEHLILDTAELSSSSPSAISKKAGMTVREMEKQLINKTLEAVSDNRTRAAELLGISIRTLRNKLREYKEDLEATQAKTAQQSG